MLQERLRQIGPEEFVQAFAKEERASKKAIFCDMKRTSNLEAYVQWFNRLSYLVASEICSVSILESHNATHYNTILDKTLSSHSYRMPISLWYQYTLNTVDSHYLNLAYLE